MTTRPRDPRLQPELSPQLGFERLFELDRGLRSGIEAAQRKALDDFPLFFQAFSFSSEVVTAGFLRLIDLFRSLGNERRIELMRTIEECQEYARYLDNRSQELTRRLIVIWESNDYLARSLVLRLFALLAIAFKDDVDVHYRINQSLVADCSYDEQRAAIRAAVVFSKLSPKFAAMALDSAMFQMKELPKYSRLRLDLVRVLENACDDPEICPAVFEYFQKLLIDGSISEHGNEHDNDHDSEHDNDHDSDHDSEHDNDHDSDHDSEHDNDHDSDHDSEHDNDHGNDHGNEHDSEHIRDHGNENDDMIETALECTTTMAINVDSFFDRQASTLEKFISSGRLQAAAKREMTRLHSAYQIHPLTHKRLEYSIPIHH